MVIGNAGSAEVRFYGPDGGYLRSAGRRGAGPGEYQDLTWMQPYRGDSLVVYDQQSFRLSILSPDGAYVRSVSLTATDDSGAQLVPVAPFADGSLLGIQSRRVGAETLATGMMESDVAYGRYSGANGERLDSIATLPGEQRHLLLEPDRIMVTTPLMGTGNRAAVHRDRVFLGFTGVQEVRAYAMDGSLQTVVRRSIAPRPLTASDLDAIISDRLEEIEDDAVRRDIAGILATLPRPEFRPAYDALMVDAGGHLWMQETVLPGEPDRWTVFAADGRMLGTIDLPPGFSPREIGEDFVLGVTHDDLGVQRLRVYELRR